MERSEVDALLARGKQETLERAVGNNAAFVDSKTWEYAKGRVAQLKKTQASAQVTAALTAGDEAILSKAASGGFDPWIEPTLKAKAVARLLELKRKVLLDRVNNLSKEGDLIGLSAFLGDPGVLADVVVTAEIRKRLASYEAPDSKILAHRTLQLDRSVRVLDIKVTESAFADPTKGLPKVVKALISGEIDQFRLSRIIHDWICLWISYDADDFLNQLGRPQDYASVLKRRSGVCAGYSALFQEMARLAGLQSRIIVGEGKPATGSSFATGTVGHAWNQVYLGTNWFNIDCTWDAGFVEGTRFHRQFSSAYFLLAPRPFSFTHWASDVKQQLLPFALSKSQFLKEPVIYGEFFRLGLSLTNGVPDLTQLSGDGSVDLSLSNNSVKVLFDVATGPSEDGVRDSILLKRNGGLTAQFSLREPGTTTVRFFARNVDELRPPARIYSGEFDMFLSGIDKVLAEDPKKVIDKRSFEVCFEEDDLTGYRYYQEDLLNPSRANFVLGVLRTIGDSTRWYNSVLVLPANSDVTSQSPGYPMQHREYVERSDFRILSPLGGKLVLGESYHFAFECGSVPEIAIIQDQRWIKLKRNGKGLFEADFVPTTEGSVKVAVPTDGPSYSTALLYSVVR